MREKLMPSLRKLLFVLFVQFTIVYVALAPCTGLPFYDLLMFHPDKNAYDLPDAVNSLKAMFGVTREDIQFTTASGAKLHGYFFKLPGSSKTVIMSHGNGGNIDYYLSTAACLLHCGVSVFLYDYEGFGTSEGEPSTQAICQDGLAAYDYLVSTQKTKWQDIILYGKSLGSIVVGETLKWRKAGGVIIDSGLDSLESVSKDTYFWLKAYPQCLFPRPELDNCRVLAGPHPPLLILHGKLDAIISPQHAVTLFAEASQPKRLVIMGRGGHGNFLLCDLKQYIGTLQQFFASLP